MALTITVSEIAAALRITADPNVAPPEPYLGILTRLRTVSENQIERYAATADAATKSEAAIRMIGYLADQPTATQGGGYAAAFRNSGAQSLLADYHSPIVVDLDDPGAVQTVTPTPSGGGTTDPVLHIFAQQGAGVPADIPVGAETNNGMMISLAIGPANAYVVLAQLASADDLAMLTLSGINLLGSAYNKGAATFQDGGETYEYWISALEQLGGQTVSYMFMRQ